MSEVNECFHEELRDFLATFPPQTIAAPQGLGPVEAAAGDSSVASDASGQGMVAFAGHGLAQSEFVSGHGAELAQQIQMLVHSHQALVEQLASVTHGNYGGNGAGNLHSNGADEFDEFLPPGDRLTGGNLHSNGSDEFDEFLEGMQAVVARATAILAD